MMLPSASFTAIHYMRQTLMISARHLEQFMPIGSLRGCASPQVTHSQSPFVVASFFLNSKYALLILHAPF